MKKQAWVHFHRRASERFGVSLSERTTEQIEECIRAGSFHRICDQRGGDVSVYRVPMGKEMSAVVYHNVRQTVLTILPIEWMSRAHRLERELSEVCGGEVLPEEKDENNANG